MDIRKTLTEIGADELQVKQYMDYLEAGNKKGQERILCRCRGMLKERLQDKRRQLSCLDYMIAKVEKSDGK